MPKRRIVFQHKTFLWTRVWDKIATLGVLFVLVVLYPGENHSVYTTIPQRDSAGFSLPFAIPTPAPYPVNTTGRLPSGEITASGVVVYDADARVYLYKRNELVPFSPASTTKILTALVALDYYGLDDVLTVSGVANDGQKMGLVAGERMTVENLLYGTLIQSGNDAAYVLAASYPGGVDGFVQAMNAKALQLSLANSHFTNPVGYDDPGHNMTPVDLTILSATALTNKTIAKMVAIPAITVSDVTHTYFHELKNVNTLLGKIPGVGGIKTGWTAQAGENLVTLVERNGHRVILVVLHSKDRFGDTQKLIDWVFGSYRWETIRSNLTL